MSTQIEAIRKFLTERSPKDLAKLFKDGMEVQVNAAPDGGERVTGEYQGHSWQGWSEDGGKTIWKHIRIPYGAWSEPSYPEGKKMSWSLEDHADAVGLTGWNWKTKKSEFVTFDFDSVANHANNALTDAEMADLMAKVSSVPWVTVRKSKSGKGRHLYVELATSPDVANHGEHAAIARSILCLLSAASGADLQGSVDCFGSVAWVWHRDTAEEGFQCVKKGLPLEKVPHDWKSHLDVVTRKKTKASAAQVGGGDDVDALVKQLKRVTLDDTHRKLLSWFATRDGKTLWSWNPDMWMLQCHTFDLKEAHAELGLQGMFYTNSTGKDRPDQNCFAFPMPGGYWQLRRHGKNIGEHASWTVDAAGWTKCDYGAPPTLEQATAAHGGNVDMKDVAHFETLKEALDALDEIGVKVEGKKLSAYLGRKAEISQNKGKGKIALRFVREGEESVPSGWMNKKKWWESYYNFAEAAKPIETPDELIRAVASNGADAGLYIWAREGWVLSPRANVISFLGCEGIPPADASVVLGAACKNYWKLVNQPFAPEYPGDRCWNRFGAQLAFDAEEGGHPTWDKIFSHLGQGLDEAVKKNKWCQAVRITTGAEYLFTWCCSLFQFPDEPLPYLFFYSKAQNTGKSTLHEALSMMFKDRRGYVQADDALTSKSRFNGSLSGAVLCAVEETDLKHNKEAYARIKSWTMGKTISIRALYENARDEQNCTHWIHTANSANYCPVEFGDTRIVMIGVQTLKDKLAKSKMFEALRAEAPAMLWDFLHTVVPATDDRARVPQVVTAAQEDQMEANMSKLDQFIKDFCEPTQGMCIPWSEFFDKLLANVEVSQRGFWTQKRVRSEMSGDYPRGRYGSWIYNAMEDSILAGREVAEKLSR